MENLDQNFGLIIMEEISAKPEYLRIFITVSLKVDKGASYEIDFRCKASIA